MPGPLSAVTCLFSSIGHPGKTFLETSGAKFRIAIFLASFIFHVSGSFGQCSEGIEIMYSATTPCGGYTHDVYVGITGWQSNDDLDFHLYQKIAGNWELQETKPNWGVPISFFIDAPETSRFGFQYTNRRCLKLTRAETGRSAWVRLLQSIRR